MKEALHIWGGGTLLVIAALILTYQFVEPAPPRSLTLSTGDPNGAYHAFGQRYKDALAKQGIAVKLLPSKGSVENISRLEKGEADVAFVQGGTAGAAAQNAPIMGLASLYFEPFWVFTRSGRKDQHLKDLKGAKIAIGAEGSGTRAMALALLTDNGITTENTQLLPIGGGEAAQALKSGEIDAALFVTSPTSQTVRSLLDESSVTLLNFERAEAYTRRHPYLSKVTLPNGVIDMAANLPKAPITLVAPAATLAARNDLHPALAVLLLQAASETHQAQGLLEDAGQFPSARYVEFPLSDDSGYFLKNGPSFLERYLPFWAANLIDRLKIMILPLLTLAIPLFKVLPPAYRWRIRSRIYRWYKDLREIEEGIAQSPTPERVKELENRLDAMEAEVREIKVPLSYADNLYSLRLHIDLIRRTINEHSAANG